MRRPNRIFTAALPTAVVVFCGASALGWIFLRPQGFVADAPTKSRALGAMSKPEDPPPETNSGAPLSPRAALHVVRKVVTQGWSERREVAAPSDKDRSVNSHLLAKRQQFQSQARLREQRGRERGFQGKRVSRLVWDKIERNKELCDTFAREYNSWVHLHSGGRRDLHRLSFQIREWVVPALRHAVNRHDPRKIANEVNEDVKRFMETFRKQREYSPHSIPSHQLIADVDSQHALLEKEIRWMRRVNTAFTALTDPSSEERLSQMDVFKPISSPGGSVGDDVWLKRKALLMEELP